MTTHRISTTHQLALDHHVNQGKAWLQTCNAGENTAALSYAALELRFAVERLAVHYWVTLLNRHPEEDEMKTVESFKRIERQIYDLAGHQREIDGHFAFIRVVLQALKIDASFVTPNIGLLSKHWSTCSELCHITWPLSCSLPELRAEAFSELSKVADDLASHVTSLGWPQLHEASFMTLKERFVKGEADEDEVHKFLAELGIWARVVYPDGRDAHFLGEAIPPRQSEPSASPAASQAEHLAQPNPLQQARTLSDRLSA